MDAYKFKAIKKFDDFEVSYTFDEEGLEVWLSELPIMDKFSTCVKILSALQAMKDAGLSPEKRLLHITKIKAFIGDLIMSMENLYIDCSFPMTSKEKASIELLTWINAEIAGNYHLIGTTTDESEISTDKRVYALNLTLKHIGNCLLYIAQTYQLPFDGLWQNCYQIYSIADQNNWLDIEVEGGQGVGWSINKTFKQVLLFALSDSNQYRPREMHKIYDLLGEFAHLSIITPNGMDHPNKECFFRIDQDLPPISRRSIKNTQADPSIYHITSTNVSQYLFNCAKDNPGGHGALKIINKSLLIRVVKTLGLGQKRKFTRMQESRDSTGIVGFDNLVAYICGEKILDVETGRTFDPRISGQWTTPNLILVEEGDEHSHQIKQRYKDKKDEQSAKIKKIVDAAGGSASDIWQKGAIPEFAHSDSGEDKIGDFEILDSSIKGYGLLWRERGLKVKVGEVFGVIVDEGKRIETGIIRTLRISTKDEIRMGIELIGMEAKYVTISKPGEENISTRAIFIPPVQGMQQEDSVIYASSDFHPGEFVEIKEIKKRTSTNCRLNRLLNSTQAISHVELFYPKENVSDSLFATED